MTGKDGRDRNLAEKGASALFGLAEGSVQSALLEKANELEAKMKDAAATTSDKAKKESAARLSTEPSSPSALLQARAAREARFASKPELESSPVNIRKKEALQAAILKKAKSDEAVAQCCAATTAAINKLEQRLAELDNKTPLSKKEDAELQTLYDQLLVARGAKSKDGYITRLQMREEIEKVKKALQSAPISPSPSASPKQKLSAIQVKLKQLQEKQRREIEQQRSEESKPTPSSANSSASQSSLSPNIIAENNRLYCKHKKEVCEICIQDFTAENRRRAIDERKREIEVKRKDRDPTIYIHASPRKGKEQQAEKDSRTYIGIDGRIIPDEQAGLNFQQRREKAFAKNPCGNPGDTFCSFCEWEWRSNVNRSQCPLLDPAIQAIRSKATSPKDIKRLIQASESAVKTKPSPSSMFEEQLMYCREVEDAKEKIESKWKALQNPFLTDSQKQVLTDEIVAIEKRYQLAPRDPSLYVVVDNPVAKKAVNPFKMMAQNATNPFALPKPASSPPKPEIRVAAPAKAVPAKAISVSKAPLAPPPVKEIRVAAPAKAVPAKAISVTSPANNPSAIKDNAFATIPSKAVGTPVKAKAKIPFTGTSVGSPPPCSKEMKPLGPVTLIAPKVDVLPKAVKQITPKEVRPATPVKAIPAKAIPVTAAPIVPKKMQIRVSDPVKAYPKTPVTLKPMPSKVAPPPLKIDPRSVIPSVASKPETATPPLSDRDYYRNLMVQIYPEPPSDKELRYIDTLLDEHDIRPDAGPKLANAYGLLCKHFDKERRDENPPWQERRMDTILKIREVYDKFAKDKLKHLPKLLVKFEGREEYFLEGILEKYAPQPKSPPKKIDDPKERKKWCVHQNPESIKNGVQTYRLWSKDPRISVAEVEILECPGEAITQDIHPDGKIIRSPFLLLDEFGAEFRVEEVEQCLTETKEFIEIEKIEGPMVEKRGRSSSIEKETSRRQPITRIETEIEKVEGKKAVLLERMKSLQAQMAEDRKKLTPKAIVIDEEDQYYTTPSPSPDKQIEKEPITPPKNFSNKRTLEEPPSAFNGSKRIRRQSNTSVSKSNDPTFSDESGLSSVEPVITVTSSQPTASSTISASSLTTPPLRKPVKRKISSSSSSSDSSSSPSNSPEAYRPKVEAKVVPSVKVSEKRIKRYELEVDCEDLDAFMLTIRVNSHGGTSRILAREIDGDFDEWKRECAKEPHIGHFMQLEGADSNVKPLPMRIVYTCKNEENAGPGTG